MELSQDTIDSFIAPRIEGIRAPTDPLPVEGYLPSTLRFQVWEATPLTAVAA